jgi:hypothetical protein
MSCRAPWNTEMVANSLDKSFVNKQLKHHRERILFEREVALLPATQPFVTKAIEIEVMKTNLLELREESKNIIYVMNNLQTDIIAMEQELRQGIVSKDADTSSTIFVRTCPRDECKGYLNTNWRCGLCDFQFCNRCHLEKNENHACNQDDVATAKLLMKNTKPCPSCAALIFKIDGCDQMFCTLCHTAYSWRTGEIERKNIHNPHYYEWVRQANNGEVPREPLDNPCREGRLPDLWELNETVRGSQSQQKHLVFELYRLLSHIMFVELPKYDTTNGNVNNNLHLRIEYMRNNISEVCFKRKLQHFERSQERKKIIHQILSMYYHVGCDMVIEFLSLETNTVAFDKKITEAFNLTDYTNAQFMTMSRTFECVVPYINVPIFTITRRKADQ